MHYVPAYVKNEGSTVSGHMAFEIVKMQQVSIQQHNKDHIGP